MITKAQLDAALSDLEKKIVKNMDVRIDAKILAEKNELKKAIEEVSSRREQADDEIFLEMEESLDKVKEDCCLNIAEVKDLKEKLSALERFIEDTAKAENFGAGIDADFDDGEIRDDFSS